EAMRPHPLERLLLPLDPAAEHGQAQPAATVLRGFGLDRRYAGVAVEAVGVGHQRPERVRARLEPPFPPVKPRGEQPVPPARPPPTGQTRLRATWLRRAKLASAGCR